MRTDHISQFNSQLDELRVQSTTLIAHKLEEIERLRQFVHHLDLMASTDRLLADTILPHAEKAANLVTSEEAEGVGLFSDPTVLPAFLRRLDEEDGK